MLNISPNLRITAKQALEHPWIKDPKKLSRCRSSVLNNLVAFKGKSVLKRAAINILVKHL